MRLSFLMLFATLLILGGCVSTNEAERLGADRNPVPADDIRKLK